jgi:phosphoglycerol transferase MdoB-like AlkP superfamily enzyme
VFVSLLCRTENSILLERQGFLGAVAFYYADTSFYIFALKISETEAYKPTLFVIVIFRSEH